MTLRVAVLHWRHSRSRPSPQLASVAKLTNTMFVFGVMGLYDISAPDGMFGPLNGALNRFSYGVRPLAVRPLAKESCMFRK